MIWINFDSQKKIVVIQRDDEEPIEIPVKVFLGTADIVLSEIKAKKEK